MSVPFLRSAWSLRRALVPLAWALVLGPDTSAAQLSTTRGWSLGVHAIGTSLTVEGSEARNGGGMSAHVGYGFNRIVTGFLHVDGSQIEIDASQVNGTWGLAHAEVGARFHFANSLRRWVPYLEGSAGARSVGVQDATVSGQRAGKVSFNGPAVTFGAGLSTFFRRSLAFDLSMKWTGGQFTEVDVGGFALQNLEIDAASYRFGIGLVWWP